MLCRTVKRAGPEHSHAAWSVTSDVRGENIQVCNLTTPAQYFHALLRQMSATSKAAHPHGPQESPAPNVVREHGSGTDRGRIPLRHHEAVVGGNPSGHLLLREGVTRTFSITGAPTRTLRCPHRPHRAALPARQRRNPQADGRDHIGVKRLVWCQEEPRYMGPYNYIWPRLEELTACVPFMQAARRVPAPPWVPSPSTKGNRRQLVRSSLHKVARTVLPLTRSAERVARGKAGRLVPVVNHGGRACPRRRLRKCRCAGPSPPSPGLIRAIRAG
jgi:hypothetical protein